MHDFALRVLSTGSDAVAVEAILASDNTHPVSTWDVFSLPPSPGEGPLTATKTSTLRRGRANRAALGFFPHLGLGFVPAPP